jgi:hypothetical protein
MLIGGYALPAYGQIRATQDIDIAIVTNSFSELVKLHERLVERGYQLPLSPNKRALFFVLTDLENRAEIKVWAKPDGVAFDDELLRRRVKVRPFDDFEMFAIGPEDFIVNKLSRKDRGVQDEMDVVSVLKLQEGKLDYGYLAQRAKAADVTGLLETLTNKIK